MKATWLVSIALAFVLSPGSLSSQDNSNRETDALAGQQPLTPGNRVHIRGNVAGGGGGIRHEVVMGELQHVTPDTLYVRESRGGREWAFNRGSILRLELSHGRPVDGLGVLETAFLGFGVGAVAGILTGLIPPSESDIYNSPRNVRVQYGVVVLGVTGFVVGSITGAIRNREHWQRLPADAYGPTVSP